MLKVDTNRDDLLNNNDNKEQELIYKYKNDDQTFEFVLPVNNKKEKINAKDKK